MVRMCFMCGYSKKLKNVLIISVLSNVSICSLAQCAQAENSCADILLQKYFDEHVFSGKEEFVCPTKGNVRAERGTIELWIKTRSAVSAIKNNQRLVRVEYDKSNVFALYFNAAEQAFIFFVRDIDSRCKNINRIGYRVFLVGPKVDWKKGEHHHIAITWTPKSERLYIDGRLTRQSFFRGCLDVGSKVKGKILIGGGNNKFLIGAVRIWDSPRFPRRIRYKSMLFEDEHARYKQTLDLSDEQFKFAERIEGENIFMCVDKKTSLPLGLVHKGSGRQWLVGEGSISVRSKDRNIENRAIERTLHWKSENGIVSLTCKLFNKLRDRDVCVDVILKLPCIVADLTSFIPVDNGIFPVAVGRRDYDYVKGAYEKYGTALPFVCLYNDSRNEGITITSGENTLERVDYDLGMEGELSDLQIIHRSVYISAGSSRQISWYFFGHAGDWRCALDAYVKMWPEILTPVKGPILGRNWGMIIGGPSDEDFLSKMSKLGVGCREVSLYLGKGAEFGNYIPDNLEPYRKVIECYRKANVTMQKFGISPMMYIQARECFDVKRASKEFGESVKKDRMGRFIINEYGPFGVSMSANIKSNWFRHICTQAERILDVFPKADGLFFDNAWSLEYSDIMCAVAEIAHNKGKSLASNGANWKSVKCSDAIMAESAWYCLGKEQYFGLVKPVVYVPIYGYGLSPQIKERNLRAPGVKENLARDIKKCLISGAFYGFNYRGIRYWPKESINLIQRYVKLQMMLKGRKWVLRGHALKLPEMLEGNIFEIPDKSLLITVVNPDDGLVVKRNDKSVCGRIRIKVNSPDRHIKKVLLYSIFNPDVPESLYFKQTGQFVNIHLDDFVGAGVIRVLFSDIKNHLGNIQSVEDKITSTQRFGTHRETISPTDFGAKGDGIADDTEAFNKLDKYIASYGGAVHVHIPMGVFMVNPLKTPKREISPGVVRRNCLIYLRHDYSNLTCDGEIKIIRGVNYKSGRKAGTEWYWSAVLISGNFCTVNGLNFSGNGTATYRGYNPKQVNIRWQGVSGFGVTKNGRKEYNVGNRIINCSIVGGGGQALALQYQKKAIVANNIFRDSSGAGFSHCEDSIICGNVATNSHDAAYYIVGSKNIVVSNNISHKTTNGSGIDVVGSENVIVSGNIIERSAAWGVLIGYSVHRKRGASKILVANNILQKNCRSPDTLFNAEVCIGRPWGDTPDSARDISVVGNKIVIDGSWGQAKGNFISVAYGAENIRISNNIISGKTNSEKTIITIYQPMKNLVIVGNQWNGAEQVLINHRADVSGRFVVDNNLNIVLNK